MPQHKKRPPNLEGGSHLHPRSGYPCITGRNLYPYFRLGPRLVCEGFNLTVCVTCMLAGLDSD